MITEQRKKLDKRELGYTLIEILAVVGVLVTVGVIVALVLFNSLRGSSKANITNKMREEGNFTLSKISREIQFAQAFVGVKADEEDSNGEEIEENFSREICEIGEDVEYLAPYHFLKILSEEREEITYSCQDISGKLDLIREMSGEKQFLFGGSEFYLKENSCYFTCSHVYITDPPTIGINFVLEDKPQTTSVSFQTSVTMRNLNR